MKTIVLAMALITSVASVAVPLRCPGWFGEDTSATVFTCEGPPCLGDGNKAQAYTQQCTHWCCPAGGGQYAPSSCSSPVFYGCCTIGSPDCAPGSCGETCGAYTAK